MEGMDDQLALQLARKGILSMEELAEQSIDELIDIEGLDEQRAGRADHDGACALVRLGRPGKWSRRERLNGGRKYS